MNEAETRTELIDQNLRRTVGTLESIQMSKSTGNIPSPRERLRNPEVWVSERRILFGFMFQARLRIPKKEFKNIYSVNGTNDGGINCYFQEGITFQKTR